jgi:hypothetical protein
MAMATAATAATAMNFKCRIECTDVGQLNFNGYPIDTQANYDLLIGVLQPENTPFIERIQIVCRTIRRAGQDRRALRTYTLKSLEFLITREIEETEFVELICRMKDCGFRSTIDNNHIQFIDTRTEPVEPVEPKLPLYDYNFRTEVPNERRIHPKVNKYRYNIHILYTR